ncbi:metal-sensitive transcriptional regulator [Candidatus Saccharibacteria bacterium]|nr:metal-sensitive transcriptional regulator [Candidatus Saccharibacteria bacterium]NCU40733.1 metal-sensitive transcriptional regulator [Candidatus Saccharibacteria bacterium]
MIQDIKKRATHRSKIIEGQFKAFVKAIEKEEYCIDILTQSLAIQQSLRSLNKLVLENHLKTHVKQGMSEGNDKTQQEIIDEMLKIYDLTNIRG